MYVCRQFNLLNINKNYILLNLNYVININNNLNPYYYTIKIAVRDYTTILF